MPLDMSSFAPAGEGATTRVLPDMLAFSADGAALTPSKLLALCPPSENLLGARACCRPWFAALACRCAQHQQQAEPLHRCSAAQDVSGCGRGRCRWPGSLSRPQARLACRFATVTQRVGFQVPAATFAAKSGVHHVHCRQLRAAARPLSCHRPRRPCELRRCNMCG